MNLRAQHILVVDDDEAIRALLRDCLELDGFQVSEAADSLGMHGVLGAGGIDLVTLDLMLGGENGLALARQIRASHDIPIVMISGKGDTIDRVVGLEIGADDYISKPFHPREVIARIRAVLRRKPPAAVATPESTPASERLSFAGWSLDIGSRELFGPDKARHMLTTAEFNLLEALVRRPQRVLSRDTIMDLLKGHDWTPFDRSIDALVSRLRRKIEVDARDPRLVKTVRGVGYMLACTVERS
ncbi:MAG: response regulator [Bosea sp.]|jgi:two-component system OmpR family response regulator|nr:response regulator [Bosea sp. (in: a-proteobacteria)]